MNRRAFLLASALALPPLLTLSPGTPGSVGVAPAGATVAALLSIDELVGASTYVVVATPGERYGVWEDLPSGKRIVTYTKLTVERAVVGAPGREIWVRTLGGVVDKIGQSVAGEAQLGTGRAMIFLAQVSGAVVVTAMAQGHYPVVADDKGLARLAASRETGMLVPRRGPTISAHEQLVGASLDEGAALVLRTRKARDDHK
jgi:hypothetical protein